MAVNRVSINTPTGEEVLIDISKDTVAPETLGEGVTAHGANGEPIVGTMRSGEDLNAVLTEQEALIAELQDILRGKAVGGGSGDDSSGIEDALLMGTVGGEYSNDRVTSIALYAFADCANLTAVNFENVASIGKYAFSNCKQLDNVSMPSLETIGERGFYFCSTLTKLDLPSLKSIGAYGLAQCQKLVTLILRGENICTLENSNAMVNIPIAKGTGYVYVPRALLSESDATKDYRQSTNWSTYAAQFRAIEDYPEICGGGA